MGNGIIREGLRCTVHIKQDFVNYFMSDKHRYRSILKLAKESEIGRNETKGVVCEEMGIYARAMAFTDELMAEVYDRLEEQGLVEDWLKELNPLLSYHLQSLRELEDQTLEVDCTPFLAYAVLKNDYCLQQLRSYMETEGEVCYQAYLESAFCDSPFLWWFPVSMGLEAAQCLGLLARIREGREQEEAYRSFIRIAMSGYKKVRNHVKRCEEINGIAFQNMTEEEEIPLRLAVSVLGLVLAEDLRIPIEMDLPFCIFLPMILRYSKRMLELPPLPAVSKEGCGRYLEMQKDYHCDNFARGYFDRFVRDDSEKDNEPLDWLNYNEIFAMYGLNLRMLHGITLSEGEVQQLFSIDPQIAERDYPAMLFAATMCKYIAGLGRHQWSERQLEELRKRREMEEQIRKMKMDLRKSQEQAEALQKEKAALEEELKSVRRELYMQQSRAERIRVQLQERLGYEEAAERRSEGVDKRNDGVNRKSGTTCPDAEGHANAAGHSARRFCQDRLAHSRILVIGGHTSWQHRMREQFPVWQFLSGEKNNFDSDSIRSKDVIIINTSVLKHSCYYRILSERGENQQVFYVHGNNPERCLEELKNQILAAEDLAR